MKAWKTVFGLVGWAGLALMLSASVASAQVNACNVPDSDFNHLECYKIRDVWAGLPRPLWLVRKILFFPSFDN